MLSAGFIIDDEAVRYIRYNISRGIFQKLLIKILKRQQLPIYLPNELHMGYKVICERHSLKEFCATMSEAKALQIQHRRQGGCLEAEIKKPRRQ